MTATTGSRDIVRRAGARPASTAAASERRELWRAEHLSVPGTGHIHFTALPSDDDLAAQLARRVAADPSDARLHVARVNHHVVDGTRAGGDDVSCPAPLLGGAGRSPRWRGRHFLSWEFTSAPGQPGLVRRSRLETIGRGRQSALTTPVHCEQARSSRPGHLRFGPEGDPRVDL